MNKMNKLWLLWASCFTLFFAACEDDHGDPVAPGVAGLILVNQGNFSQGNGSLDLYLPEREEMQQNVYQSVNGEPVGGIIESASINDNSLVVLVNQSGGPGKVIFADASTLEKQHEVADENTLYSPRYAAFTNTHVFVSVWGAFDANFNLKNSSIAAFNRTTHQLEKSIPVPSGPEGVLVDGSNLWVANSFTDSITIINTSTLEVAQKFKSVSRPSKLEKASNGKVYMLTGDTLSRYNPSTFALEQKMKLPGKVSKWQFVGNTLYLLTQEMSADYTTSTNALYKLDINQASAQAEQLLQMQDARVFWVNPVNNEIYLGIAAGADPGALLRLQTNGSTEVDRKAAGVFPHQFIAR